MTESPPPGRDDLRYLLQQIAARVDARRRQGARVARCAVGFRFTDAQPPRELTLLVDAAVTVIDGVLAPPGLPHATLSLAGADFLALLRGAVRGEALLTGGRLGIDGRADLLLTLAACFPEGKNWLSVRM